MIRYAIVGCGRIAARHAEHICSHGKLVAVCDINKEKANAFAKTLNAACWYSLNEMLASKPEADVIAICTPNGLHAEQTILCLEAGYHVICEKPMAITSADCRKMIAASENAGKKLFIVKQNRYNPPVAVLKDLLQKNILGKIYNVQLNCFWNRNSDYYKDSWHGNAELDGGTLFTQFSHFIDILYWVAGDVQECCGYISNYNHKGIIDFEDTGTVSFLMMNGITGTLHYTVNSHKKNMEGSITVFAEKGTVKIGGEYLNKLEYQDIADHSILNLPEGNSANNYGGYTGSMSNHDKVYKNVHDVLISNEPVFTNVEDGLKTVEIIEIIYKSVRRL